MHPTNQHVDRPRFIKSFQFSFAGFWRECYMKSTLIREDRHSKCEELKTLEIGLIAMLVRNVPWFNFPVLYGNCNVYNLISDLDLLLYDEPYIEPIMLFDTYMIHNDRSEISALVLLIAHHLCFILNVFFFHSRFDPLWKHVGPSFETTIGKYISNLDLISRTC